jgi:hypothetical protein
MRNTPLGGSHRSMMVIRRRLTIKARDLANGTCHRATVRDDTMNDAMEDQRPEFMPTIIEDEAPGTLVIFSSTLVEKLKSRRESHESSGSASDDNVSSET